MELNKVLCHIFFIYIGIASCGRLGHVPPNDFQLFNFSGHFRAAQTRTMDSMCLISKKKILAYSAVSVYCMISQSFSSVNLKLFSLSFVPLHTHRFNGHFPGEFGIAGCLLIIRGAEASF